MAARAVIAARAVTAVRAVIAARAATSTRPPSSPGRGLNGPRSPSIILTFVSVPAGLMVSRWRAGALTGPQPRSTAVPSSPSGGEPRLSMAVWKRRSEKPVPQAFLA